MLSNVGFKNKNKTPFPLLEREADTEAPSTVRGGSNEAATAGRKLWDPRALTDTPVDFAWALKDEEVFKGGKKGAGFGLVVKLNDIPSQPASMRAVRSANVSLSF